MKVNIYIWNKHDDLFKEFIMEKGEIIVCGEINRGIKNRVQIIKDELLKNQELQNNVVNKVV
jgi:hypothetical protein